MFTIGRIERSRSNGIGVHDPPERAQLSTAAGVTSGIDLALALVEEDYGRDIALIVARYMVVFLKRPGGQSQFSAHLTAQIADKGPIQSIAEHILTHLRSDLSVDLLAGRANMSTRNFSRVFLRDIGVTPADFVEAARLDAARRMLQDSEMPLQRIADRCGFADVHSMRRVFQRKLGVGPTDYRALLQTLPQSVGVGQRGAGERAMSDFKGRHFEGEIVLWAVRWYCRYGISYRDLEQMMGERGVSVDHSTIYRWVQKYAPEIEKRLRWQWRGPLSTSWRVDETYVKVRGQWTYLYRAIDKYGNTIDFCLSPTRKTAAAKRFLGKVLNGLKDWEKPTVINTDKAPTYAAAIAELKKEGKCPRKRCIDRSSI